MQSMVWASLEVGPAVQDLLAAVWSYLAARTLKTGLRNMILPLGNCL